MQVWGLTANKSQQHRTMQYTHISPCESHTAKNNEIIWDFVSDFSDPVRLVSMYASLLVEHWPQCWLKCCTQLPQNIVLTTGLRCSHEPGNFTPASEWSSNQYLSLLPKIWLKFIPDCSNQLLLSQLNWGWKSEITRPTAFNWKELPSQIGTLSMNFQLSTLNTESSWFSDLEKLQSYGK